MTTNTKPGTAAATLRVDGTTHKQGLLITTTPVTTIRVTGTDTRGPPIPSSKYAMASVIVTMAAATFAAAAEVRAWSRVHDQKICHA